MSAKSNITGYGNASISSKTSSIKSNKLNKRKIKNKDKRIHSIIKEIPQSKDNQTQIPITRINMARIKGKTDKINKKDKRINNLSFQKMKEQEIITKYAVKDNDKTNTSNIISIPMNPPTTPNELEIDNNNNNNKIDGYGKPSTPNESTNNA
eukprot:302358_1